MRSLLSVGASIPISGSVLLAPVSAVTQFVVRLLFSLLSKGDCA